MEEIGTLTLARTKFFNPLYVYQCVRRPGYVLEFSCRKGTLFHCCGCKRNGKTRCITVINSAIVTGVKHPEDDHHPRCLPLEHSGVSFALLHANVHKRQRNMFFFEERRTFLRLWVFVC